MECSLSSSQRRHQQTGGDCHGEAHPHPQQEHPHHNLQVGREYQQAGGDCHGEAYPHPQQEHSHHNLQVEREHQETVEKLIIIHNNNIPVKIYRERSSSSPARAYISSSTEHQQTVGD